LTTAGREDILVGELNRETDQNDDGVYVIEGIEGGGIRDIEGPSLGGKKKKMGTPEGRRGTNRDNCQFKKGGSPQRGGGGPR